MGNTAYAHESELSYLPIDMVKTNPYQPRKFFDRAGLQELCASIKEYGLMQPITVRIVGSTYELVAGERRLRASKMAGYTTIPAIIVSVSEQDSAVMAMIENLQRQNLHFFEEAIGLANLAADYGLTQEEIAQRIGKSQSAVANKLRLLRLPREVQRILTENELTERHARALLRLDTEEQQLSVLRHIINDGLTVQRTEQLVEQCVVPLTKLRRRPKIRGIYRDLRIFTNTFSQTVEKMRESGLNAWMYRREDDEGIEIVIRVVG
ncbi:MAG: ParB/RepB/Spo0J family partition protein [Defluviitaleaceae bacterium]|nr:ParB/RepB/Spo0J family partition protein [Defluviitaleaceae bacterium]